MSMQTSGVVKVHDDNCSSELHTLKPYHSVTLDDMATTIRANLSFSSAPITCADKQLSLSKSRQNLIWMKTCRLHAQESVLFSWKLHQPGPGKVQFPICLLVDILTLAEIWILVWRLNKWFCIYEACIKYWSQRIQVTVRIYGRLESNEYFVLQLGQSCEILKISIRWLVLYS